MANPYPYDIQLMWGLLEECNLKCEYCYNRDQSERVNWVKGPTRIIDIPSLIRTLDETGKIFRINYYGGEPFLVPNLVEASIELTKKHFVSMNSNLVCDGVEEFASKIDPKRVANIHASLHIKQLEERALLDRYIRNFLAFKEKGFTIVAVEVAYPALVKEVKRYRKFFAKKGIKLEFNPFMGSFNGKSYPRDYTAKELKIFGLTTDVNVDAHYYRGQLCNAGYNIGLVQPNGDIYFCEGMLEPMGNIYKGIKVRDKMTTCESDICTCPFPVTDIYLFHKALRETGIWKKEGAA